MIKTRNLIIICLLVALIFLTVGFFSARIFSPINADKYQIGYQAGWNAAKERLKATVPFEYDSQNMVITSIFGKVEKIDNNLIYLKTASLELLSDAELDTRIIEITDETSITQVVQKSEQQYRQELNKFFEEHKELANKPDAAIDVSSSNETKANLSDIKIGDNLKIEASEDIKNKKRFSSIKINILD